MLVKVHGGASESAIHGLAPEVAAQHRSTIAFGCIEGRCGCRCGLSMGDAKLKMPPITHRELLCELLGRISARVIRSPPQNFSRLSPSARPPHHAACRCSRRIYARRL